MKKIDKDNKAIVYLLSTFAIMLWGMSYIWIDRLINAGIPVFYFVFIRILLAGLVLLLFNFITGKLAPVQKRDIPKFILLAFFEPFIYFMTESYGIKETGSPTLSAMIIATIPIFSVVAGRVLFKERINWINAIGILLSMGGICLVVMCNGTLGNNFIWGIILLVIAVLSEVGHASVTKSLSCRYESQTIVMYQFLIGSVYFLPFFLKYGIADFQPYYFSAEIWMPILCLAVLCSSVAFSLWVTTIKSLGVSKSSIFTALIPVAAAIVAWALGHELLSARQWAGIAISTVGVILSQYVTRKNRQSAK
ncbi:MAG: DMT family transporter [Clostridium sp.]|nr:DMT family transporter [Bacteroides sp.]MCM1198747.1 DMT family transporter [Clostridium sp.]